MLKKLLKLLNTLPFDGNKTKIGAWLLGLSGIAELVHQLDPEAMSALVALLTTPPINWVAIGVLILGLVHKYLKNKFKFL